MEIRDATDTDLPQILAIYNDVITNTTAIYDETLSTLEERRAWFEARKRQGWPVLVAAEGAEVLGFASFGEWRARWGYRYTVEHSVHVRTDCRGQGIGRSAYRSAVSARARQGSARDDCGDRFTVERFPPSCIRSWVSSPAGPIEKSPGKRSLARPRGAATIHLTGRAGSGCHAVGNGLACPARRVVLGEPPPRRESCLRLGLCFAGTPGIDRCSLRRTPAMFPKISSSR
ncbi:MAG: N-acetyltransferase family protein [Gammaproteobacteria bacterium]